MATSNHPFVSAPETTVDSPTLPEPPPQEDLTQPVPLGEPDEDSYVIHEEDRELPAPTGQPR